MTTINLQFTKADKYYVAEFKIESPIHLHIEREKVGDIYMSQKCIEEGNYDYVKDFGFNRGGDKVIDATIMDVICPMWIKIESVSPVNLAVVISDEDIEVL